MKRLTGSRVAPSDRILQKKLANQCNRQRISYPCWRRHFQKALNVDSVVKEEALAGLEDHSHVETPEVSREEVESAVKKLQNKKAAGEDRIVVELVKNGGEAMIDWLMELLQEV